MTHTAILASIYPHEQEAMLKLVQLARALSSTLDGREAAAMRVWAQMVEEVIERIEQKEIMQ